MAEREFRPKDQGQENIRGIKREQEPAKLKAHEATIDQSTLKDTGVSRDTRLLHSVDAGQKTQLIQSLQRTHGNAFVQRLLKSGAIQAKLTVNPPDDQYEKEADRVAQNFAKASTSSSQRQEIPEEEEEVQTKLQRQTEEEEVQVKSLQRQEVPEEEVQMKSLQKQEVPEEEIQTKASVSKVPERSEGLEARIQTARSGGKQIPDSVRNSFEPHFGRDFGQVRLHTDSEADTLSQELQARAFTTGSDVFFRSGDYNPDTEDGKKLLAHELTHVVQQGAAPVSRKPEEAEG